MNRVFQILTLFILFMSLNLLQAQSAGKLSSSTFASIEARHIGPAAMSGRVTWIDAVNSDPRTIYVASAGGGIWKSINGGASFKPVFDKYNQSIGYLAIDQKHPETVWAGTGESNMRNSVSVGDGLYKTNDGGENWSKVGLDNSERISKIVIDPQNSDVVYVAVPGALWSDSKEKGLYKTTDGGKTWELILFVNEKTGCADVEIDPKNSNVLYASTWQFRRTPWSFSSGGTGSGLHKSEDAGKTWRKIDKMFSADGILGRICIAVAPSQPSNVYALVESKKSALYSSTDFGETWKKESATENAVARPFYFSVLKVDPVDAKRIYRPSYSLSISVDGGKSFTEPGGEAGYYHGDLHAIWINPNNNSHLLLGTDGGAYLSLDKGFNWRFLNNLPLSQFYHVSVDSDTPYNVYGGLQDNNSWYAPSRNPAGIKNGDWKPLSGGDGFWVFRDRTNKDYYYSESQGGNLVRTNVKRNEGKDIKPTPPMGIDKLRFNWNTPIHLSALDPKVMYTGSQFLHRSSDRGDSWEQVSPDLTTNDSTKLKQEESGGLSVDNSSAENHCTIFAISESPVDKNIIWVGTDDGNVQVSKDFGKTWQKVNSNIPGLPANSWCSSIEAGLLDKATALATFDNHAMGDKNTYVYKTTDYGVSWISLATSDLNGYAHKIKADLLNKNLLFLGTENGLFVSIDSGGKWVKYNAKVPPVAVRDIVIEPVTNDLVLATHGRGVLIVDDITPIRAMTQDILDSEAFILPSRPSFVAGVAYGGAYGQAGEFVGANPTDEAVIYYYLRDRDLKGEIKVEIVDSRNKTVIVIPGSIKKGINRVTWNMRLKPPKMATAVRLAGGGFTGLSVPEGDYTVRLVRGDKVISGKLILKRDPDALHSAEDCRMQYEIAMKLYKMNEDLAYVNEVILRLQKELTKAGDESKDDNFKKQISEFKIELTDLHKSMVATKEGMGITGEEKLREKLSDLYSNVASYPGKPSKQQLNRMNELGSNLEKAIATKDKLISNYLDKVNGFLNELGKSKIVVYPIGQFEEDKEKEKGNR